MNINKKIPNKKIADEKAEQKRWLRMAEAKQKIYDNLLMSQNATTSNFRGAVIMPIKELNNRMGFVIGARKGKYGVLILTTGGIYTQYENSREMEFIFITHDISEKNLKSVFTTSGFNGAESYLLSELITKSFDLRKNHLEAK